MRLLLAIFSATIWISGVISDPSAEYSLDEEQYKDDIGTLINNTINTILASIPDPLIIDPSTGNFDNIILTGEIDISDFALAGIKSFVATDINVNLNPFGQSLINFSVNIGDINLFTNYDMKLILGQILPFFGKGNLSVNLDNLQLQLSANVKVSVLPPKITGISNLQMEFSIGKNTGASIFGLLNNEGLCESINDFLRTFIQRFVDFLDVNKDRIGKLISSLIQEILNSIIK